MSASSRTALTARDLTVSLAAGGDVVRGASLHIMSGETLALVGESGSGKTVTALALMGLLPPSMRVRGGRVAIGGRETADMSAAARRRMMGRDIAMIYQEPMNALNPVQRVGDQIAEAIHCHETVSSRAARARAESLLALVRMPEPARRALAYPHELSGGMRQRAMIAMALSCRPSVLIADEPTTALDAAVQAQILFLLAELCEKFSMAVLLITHDFGVVAATASRAAVMYRGRVVESASVGRLLTSPAHPYTRALLRCIPRPEMFGGRLPTIPGRLPPVSRTAPVGCGFASRCERERPVCRREEPALSPADHFSREVRCFFPYKTAAGGDEVGIPAKAEI